MHGLGASDMKGGVAVALELVRDLPGEPARAYDVALLLFGREELPERVQPAAGALRFLAPDPRGEPGVLLEPTDCRLQLGCVGNMNARLVFHGVSGHAARPWLADNAIERAIEGLAPIAALERREAVVGGLPFYEVVTLTRLHAGIADNVVPDRAVAHLNFRYAPDRDPDDAEAFLRSLVPTARRSSSPATRPPRRRATDSPLVDELRARRPRGRAEAGVDERRRLRLARASPPSTSGPARRATPTPATSRSRSRSLVRVYEVLSAVPTFARAVPGRRSERRTPSASLPRPPRAGDVPVRPARASGRRARSAGARR